VVIAGVLAISAATAWAAPRVARHIEFFRVRQIELVGVRYLTPDSVLGALRLRPDQNLFDATAPIERRAAELAGVVSARVERRMPGTLRVIVVEQVPIAFAPGRTQLEVLDGEGRRLPYDPSATGLDLPVIPRADTALVRTLSVVRASDSTLFQGIDGVRPGAAGTVVLDLGARRVLLRGVPSTDEVRAIGAVRRHLAATGRPYDELDARYAGWLVVRRNRT
jgi:cell division septal protein FtsQ